MHMETRIASKPAFDGRSLVRTVVVHHQVHVEFRGGSGFSDRGVSGYLSGQYSNRRADIHEKAKT